MSANKYPVTCTEPCAISYHDFFPFASVIYAYPAGGVAADARNLT